MIEAHHCRSIRSLPDPETDTPPKPGELDTGLLEPPSLIVDT